MVETLEPCPLCGGEAEPLHEGYGYVSIRCKSCALVMMAKYTLEAAYAAWNTRHRTATLQQVIDLANACVDQGIPLTAMIPMLEDMR